MICDLNLFSTEQGMRQLGIG